MSTNLVREDIRKHAQDRANRTRRPVAIWSRKGGGAYINDSDYLLCKVGENHAKDGRLVSNYTLVHTVEPFKG